jgi:hypothetical protein
MQVYIIIMLDVYAQPSLLALAMSHRTKGYPAHLRLATNHITNQGKGCKAAGSEGVDQSCDSRCS